MYIKRNEIIYNFDNFKGFVADTCMYNNKSIINQKQKGHLKSIVGLFND